MQLDSGIGDDCPGGDVDDRRGRHLVSRMQTQSRCLRGGLPWQFTVDATNTGTSELAEVVERNLRVVQGGEPNRRSGGEVAKNSVTDALVGYRGKRLLHGQDCIQRALPVQPVGFGLSELAAR